MHPVEPPAMAEGFGALWAPIGALQAPIGESSWDSPNGPRPNRRSMITPEFIGVKCEVHTGNK